MGSRNRKKAESPSNASLVRHWRASEESDAAWSKFHDGVYRLLDAGRLGGKRLEAVSHYMASGEEFGAFLEDVERLAVSPSRIGLRRETEEPLLLNMHLFAVPLSGTEEGIADFLDDDEQFDALAKSFRASGYCMQNSNVLLFEVPLSLIDLAHATPNDLYDLAQASLDCCTDPDGKRGRAKADRILRRLQREELHHADGSGKGHLATRVLVGAQMTVMEDENTVQFDGMAVLRGEMDEFPNEAEELMTSVVDGWGDLMELVPYDDLIIDNPVPWGDVRHTMLELHVDQSINIMLAFDGLGDVSREVDLALSVEGPVLTLQPIYRGRDLMKIEIPGMLLPYGQEAFFHHLDQSYRSLGVPEELSEGNPALVH
jgi:hypothetical protein